MKFVPVKLIFLISVMTALLSFVPASEALHSLFQTFDRNEDGKIDQKEFSENMIEYAFKKLDFNDSGAITRTEWDITENVKDREKHDELFRVMDSDKDEDISFIEFSTYSQKHSNIEESFITLDKDKNGVLSPHEIFTRPPFIMITIHV